MDKIGKPHKVSYKTYHNERLKKNLFHNKLMHPLYVQVIFDRLPIIFKSYYYDLFSKSKYLIRVAGREYAPDIEEIAQKEKELIEFIIDKNNDEFSLKLFKKEYAYYSRDLLDMMEGGFLDYVETFFSDEGMPFVATVLRQGATDCKAYDLVMDLKLALNKPLYKKLLDNSFDYAPPYLPLYEFAQKQKKGRLVSRAAWQWEALETKEGFRDFFRQHYPDRNAEELMEQIQQWAGKK